MDYLEELNQQMYRLKKGQKVRFDTCFIISEPTKSFCVNINQKLSEFADGKIRMGNDSIIFPHISLFMGYINDYNMLKEVLIRVESYSRETAPFSLDFRKMHIDNTRTSLTPYVFLDSYQNAFLKQQKIIIDKYLRDIVHPNHWDIKKSKPHITIGCYKGLADKAQQIICSDTKIPSCKISHVGVSLTGSFGVCLGLLKLFELTGGCVNL